VTRERDLVELVDPTGVAVGESTVDEAHRPPGQLHRAFSIVLMDPAGRLLLQRRAAVKTRFPLRWANACCGHPGPGVPVTDAALRRLDEELGVARVTVSEVGVYVYQASDPETGRVEHEYDHVLLGRVDDDLPMLPDPAEVAEVCWADPEDIDRDLAKQPSGYAPWLSGVLALVPKYGFSGLQSE
jgi:isopentenyl-diphosphate delta-isomerase